jgi:hypothetical protein
MLAFAAQAANVGRTKKEGSGEFRFRLTLNHGRGCVRPDGPAGSLVQWYPFRLMTSCQGGANAHRAGRILGNRREFKVVDSGLSVRNA